MSAKGAALKTIGNVPKSDADIRFLLITRLIQWIILFESVGLNVIKIPSLTQNGFFKPQTVVNKV